MLTKSTDENFLQVNLSFEAYIYVFLLDQDHLTVGQDLTVEADLGHETELVEFFTRVRERRKKTSGMRWLMALYSNTVRWL